jgi:hypothetical protein
MSRRKRSILLGIMSEICIKAKILHQKLKNDPDAAEEVFTILDALEEEMLLCVSKFESLL